MLTASAIVKRFGATLALDRVSFTARAGEIHALLGENGAGKSTLAKILAGLSRPESGSVTLDGVPVRAASGIAMVAQSPLLFERFSWEENLALGGFNSTTLDLREVAKRAAGVAAELGFELPLAGATLERSSVPQRVRLEIIRALSFDPRVLIFDEPTGLLAPTELSSFLELLRRLRGQGRAVLLITHKLSEAMAAADRITVLRRGQVVAETTPAQTSEAGLARLMVGDLSIEIVEQDSAAVRAQAPPASSPLVKVINLELVRDGTPILRGLSVELFPGEIAGLAGVDGNGQVELVEVMAGVLRPMAGRIEVGQRIVAGCDRDIAVIPQDRDVQGLILGMEVWENAMLSSGLRGRTKTRWGFLDRAAAVALTQKMIERFRIRASGPRSEVAALSGGNRQRLAVARALAAQPRLLVAHNVSRGLDLASTAEVHAALREFAAAGNAVWLISSDLEELLGVCDRLAVISRGQLTPVAAADRNAERLGLLMSGVV